MGAIESLRRDMANDKSMLSWGRPWLRDSAELRRRVGADEGSDFTAQQSVADAVSASKPEGECQLLFTIVRRLAPMNVLEMGTNVGVSGAYLAAGLCLNGAGRLATLEGAPPKVELADRTFRTLGLTDYARTIVGAFHDTLDPVLNDLGEVDLAFIDGFHDGQATVSFYRRVADMASTGATLVFDDINWSAEMGKAWRTISSDQRVSFTANVGPLGVCFLR